MMFVICSSSTSRRRTSRRISRCSVLLYAMVSRSLVFTASSCASMSLRVALKSRLSSASASSSLFTSKSASDALRFISSFRMDTLFSQDSCSESISAADTTLSTCRSRVSRWMRLFWPSPLSFDFSSSARSLPSRISKTRRCAASASRRRTPSLCIVQESSPRPASAPGEWFVRSARVRECRCSTNSRASLAFFSRSLSDFQL
mmetsp:Transcript_44331/g.139228  ORF Transcript_44331/g.139228 Transcript_44331/m.139228 type:complete len:203 (+) Transcript_44331:2860-3468(+)